MLNSIKNKIAGYLIGRHLKKKIYEVQSFKNIFKDADTFLILMPENEYDFHYALEFVKQLEISHKNITLLSRDYRISLLPQKYRANVIGYSLEDTGRFNLPSKKLREKFASFKFNIVMDLNREENLFCSFAANIVNTPFRVGITKNNSDKYYNFQVSNSEDNPEIFYKNFLNCLQMF